MTSTMPNKPSSSSTTPNSAGTDDATKKVAAELVEMCKSGKGTDAIQKLYADNARHVEAMEMPGQPRITEGKPALIERSERFYKTNTIHSSTCSDPLVNGEQFTCEMSMDLTSNEGPMAGKRSKMSETCVYTVQNDKIAEAKFFYTAGAK